MFKIAFSADVIIGAHGANLVQVMFSRPGVQVIEIRAIKSNGCFCTLTAAVQGAVYRPVYHAEDKEASNYKLSLDDALLPAVTSSLDALDRLEVTHPQWMRRR